MRVFFCNSGAESIECAIKLARRRATSGHKLIAAEGSFHGRTFGALAATGQRAKQEPFDPMLPGFAHIPFGDIEAMEKAFDEKVIAVLLEPIQGEGGVIPAPPGYLERVRALCDENGSLLILDEVQTAVGRTGAWFAHELFGVQPDVVCLAKGLAGGLPIGACLATPAVAAAFRPGDHASTFGGGPVQCSAALATIDVIEEEGLLTRAMERGLQLKAGLEALFGAGRVRGVGLMLAADVGPPLARDICARALERGVLVNDVAPTVLRFTPPLVITPADIDDALHVIQEVAHEVQAA
jgi:acetylornithine/N-succinyldiaminopimelate aminotransferase